MTILGKLRKHIEDLINNSKKSEQEIELYREQIKQLGATLYLIDEKNVMNISNEELARIQEFLSKLFDEATAESVINNINMIKIFYDNLDENEPQIETIKNNYKSMKRFLETQKSLLESDVSKLESRIKNKNPNLEKYLSYITNDSIVGENITDEELKDILNIIKYTTFDENIKLDLITAFGKHVMNLRQSMIKAVKEESVVTNSEEKKVKKEEKKKEKKIEEKSLTNEEIKQIGAHLASISEIERLPIQELNIITSMKGLIKEGNIDDARNLSDKYPIEKIQKYILIREELIDQMNEYLTIKSMKEDYYIKEENGIVRYQKDIEEIINKIRNTLTKIDNIKEDQKEEIELAEDSEELDIISDQAQDRNIVIYLTNSSNNENYLVEDQKEIMSSQKIVMKKVAELINQLKKKEKVSGKREEVGVTSIDALSPYYLSSGKSDTRSMIVYIEIPVSSEARNKISESYNLEKRFKIYLVVGSGIKNDRRHSELNNRMKNEIFNIFDIINLFSTKNMDKELQEKLIKLIDEGYTISSSIISNPFEPLNARKGETR